ncbi:MAG TPA: LPP20 family lipoprotein [Candidatus Coprenecus stercoravium]|uniref:LPP20 family lipoprotein n=1 Tax=Candidatus Coprenecus stercoravium TaxID=2840735 RepID=A0A9D2KB83_9BACT|nr:LPP20 family lipoprotein [Candidatus Coprenecus stercoravium]
MKTQSIIALTVSASLLFLASSCGGQKQAANTYTPPVEEVMPFDTPEFKSNAEFFRAKASGVSADRNMAKTVARTSALNELATQVEVVVKSVIQSYANQYQVGMETENVSKIQNMAVTAVSQQLNGAILKDEKSFRMSDGRIEYWVVLEMSRVPVMEAAESAIAADEKLGIDFNEFKFQEFFNQQMKDLEARENAK